MKKLIFTFLLAFCLCAAAFGAKKPATAFAIVTDSKTYSECTAEIDAYASVLEKEGLKTYIVSGEWNNPDEVKARILALSKKKPALEGIVLVGDVPIVMVRGAQFMTTAFKMNEKTFPIFQSSVASDRFYDDFDLQFDFLEKDAEQENVFYYRLAENSTTRLHPDIYSARMKVPAVMEGDKYEIMRKYLRKVVAAHKEQGNTLDRLIFFAGHGYNSDCLTVWRQKPVVYKEVFPYAFERASGYRFLNFREKSQMKWELFNELQRPGTDLFQFSEHGAFDTQYINGGEEAKSFDDCIYQLKSSLVRAYKRYKGTPDEESFFHEVDSLFHIEPSAFSDSALASYKAKALQDRADANISAKELTKIKSEPRIVILNACYNGSFHNPKGYVAGCHVFGDGACVVAQGNTVNVLQDKWEDELIGYLSIGERVGMWQKELCWLESHLIGDPTFRFAPHSGEEAVMAAKLHKDLVFNASKAKVWKEYAGSDNSLLRAAGIVHLGYLGAQEGSDMALEMLQNDPSPMVRLHALQVLWKYADANALMGARIGMQDPYEMVVRSAVRMADSMGSEDLLDAVESVMKEHPEMVRACFQAQGAKTVLVGKSDGKRAKKALDKSLETETRINLLRTFRNNNTLSTIEPMLSIVKDKSDDMEVRLVAAEALGWFEYSVGRQGIIEALKEYKAGDAELDRIISVTLHRLEKY